jgi:hypothetical protein
MNFFLKPLASLIIIGLAVTGLTSCTHSDTWDGYYYVKYRVTGTTYATDISYLEEDGDFKNVDDQVLPWEKELVIYCRTKSSNYAGVSIGANAVWISGGTKHITLEIYTKKTATGAYGLLASQTQDGSGSINVSLTRVLTP